MVYFVASKLLLPLLVPSNLILLLVAAGWALILVRWRRAGLVTLAAGLLLFVAVGLGPVGLWLGRLLEDRFPSCPADPTGITGAIVLGGAVDSNNTRDRGQLALTDAAERIVTMADLARRHPDWTVIFTGGSGLLLREALSEADIVEENLDHLGLPAGRIRFERESRNTYENAQFTARMLHPDKAQRWLLVTSAMHMPRSVGLFRAAGFTIVPCPVDYRTYPSQPPIGLRISDGLAQTDAAMREYVGLVAARFLGQTHAIFPGPDEGLPAG